MKLVLHRSELYSPQLHRSNKELQEADRFVVEHALSMGENCFLPSPSRCSYMSSSSTPASPQRRIQPPSENSYEMMRSRQLSSAATQLSSVRATILCSKTEQPVEQKCAATCYGQGTVGLGRPKITAITKDSQKQAVDSWSQRRDDFERAERQRQMSERAALEKQERESHKGGGFNVLREAIERSMYNKMKALREDKRKMDLEKKAMTAEARALEAARLAYVREEKQAHREAMLKKKQAQEEMRQALATMGWLHLEARARSLADNMANDAALVVTRRESVHVLRTRSTSSCRDNVSALRQRNTESASLVRKVERRCHSAQQAAQLAHTEAAKALSKSMRKEHEQNMGTAEMMRDRVQFENRKVVTKAHELYEARKRDREAARQLKAAKLLEEKLARRVTAEEM